MPNLMEIGQTLMNIMKVLVVTSKIVAVASRNAKKIGKEMYLKNLNSWSLIIMGFLLMKRIIQRIYLVQEERDIMSFLIKLCKKSSAKIYASRMPQPLLRKNQYKYKSMILLSWKDMIKNDFYFNIKNLYYYFKIIIKQ